MEMMSKREELSISRREFLGTTCKTAIMAGLTNKMSWANTLSLPDPSKMNIIFFDNEDFTANALECYGNPIVKTPNLNKLAKKGVMFTRAYCNAVICNPSRASFLTGLRPESTHVFNNPTNMSKVIPKSSPHLPGLLKQKGAYLINIGKLYHQTHYADKQYCDFDQLEFIKSLPKGYKGLSRYYGKAAFTPEEGLCEEKGFLFSDDESIESELISLYKRLFELDKKIPKNDFNPIKKDLKNFRSLWTELLGDSGHTEECMLDGREARYAAQRIKELTVEGKQFFMSIGFHKPHTSLVAPKKYVDMYDPGDIPLTVADPSLDMDIPACALNLGKNNDIFSGMYDDKFPQLKYTPERAKKAIASYYACASFIDAQMGIVLDALEDAGIADNTIVIFFGDHGFQLGEHGRWSKYTLFEQTTRVPLIMYVPGAKGNGRACHEIVELVDLLPTLCDLWQIKKPGTFEGISLYPLLEDPKKPWKKAAFTTSDLNNYIASSVRTKRFRYSEWKLKDSIEKEFYDLEQDPWEHINKAGDPACRAQINELADLLKSGWKAALP